MGKPENIPLEKRIWIFAEKAGLLKKGDRVLVAVSGGLDSVVLLHLLQQLPLQLEVAHMNFRLRGEESEEDARFVENLSRKAGLPFHLRAVDPGYFEGKSIQTEARRLRYAWFEELASSAMKVALAHQAEDQAETLLLNLLRGTGLKGLGGMRAKRGMFVRPLLQTHRAEIKDYAMENGLQWREDSSNQSTKYLRNFLRLRAIPLLQEAFPQLVPNLQHSACLLQTSWEALGLLVEDLHRLFLKEKTAGGVCYSFSEIARHIQGAFFLSYRLHELGFHADQITQIKQSTFDTETKSWKSMSGYLVERKSDGFWIWRPGPFHVDISVENTQAIQLPLWGTFLLKSLESYPENIKTSQPNKAFLGHVEFPLRLKSVGEQSYAFQPFGLKGKSKKLADVLTEAGLTREQKKRTLILTDKTGHLCWVSAVGISWKCRIEPHEKGPWYHLDFTPLAFDPIEFVEELAP